MEIKIFGNKEITLKDSQEAIAAYRANNSGKETFIGLLFSMGLSINKFNNLGGDGKELLEMYRTELEVRMVETLTYQTNIPRNSYGKAEFDFKYLQWLLAKSNPEVYGENRKEMTIKSKTADNLKSQLNNISGISFTQKVKNE